MMLAACSPEQAKRFEYGDSIPSFVLRIEFDGTMHVTEISGSIAALVEELGFVGHPPTKDNWKDATFSLEPPIYFKYTPPSPDDYHFIRFTTYPPGEVFVGRLDLRFANAKIEEFSELEWRYFKLIRFELLPKFFPNAQVTVSTPPEDYTDPSLVERLRSEGR
ncbi:MAG: hypothetical protein QNJ19_09065 [Woeseiaceae bacterium]|nr:hypothetical protein [Woeseiaceae bacterium]